jgi:crossover junction endodeoxyribonuclease RusA
MTTAEYNGLLAALPKGHPARKGATRPSAKGYVSKVYAATRPKAFSMPYGVRLVLPYPPTLNHLYANVQGRKVLSREGRAYKAVVKSLVAATYIVDDEVKLTIAVYRPRRSGDLDNTLKVVLDSMSGLVYADDKQIRHIDAERFEDKANPRVEVLVERGSAAPAGAMEGDE